VECLGRIIVPSSREFRSALKPSRTAAKLTRIFLTTFLRFGLSHSIFVECRYEYIFECRYEYIVECRYEYIFECRYEYIFEFRYEYIVEVRY
jgi:hypothetical protein